MIEQAEMAVIELEAENVNELVGSRMCDVLADLWEMGHYDHVRMTINNAYAPVSKAWHQGVADKLPEENGVRESFLNYMAMRETPNE